MRKLTMMDGTEFVDCECGLADGVLWCYMKGVPFHEAVAAFDNPEKTGRIIFTYGEMMDVYEGFTRITAAVQQKDGRVDIALEKPQEVAV